MNMTYSEQMRQTAIADGNPTDAQRKAYFQSATPIIIPTMFAEFQPPAESDSSPTFFRALSEWLATLPALAAKEQLIGWDICIICGGDLMEDSIVAEGIRMETPDETTKRRREWAAGN